MMRHCTPYSPTLILLPALIWLAAACHKPEGYHAFHALPTDGWSKHDTVTFTLPRLETTAHCRAFVEIRHSGHYPYRSIWLTVSRNTADSLTFHTDTVECRLTDDKGHFDGTGLNDLYQKRFPLSDVILQAHTAPLVKIAPFLKDQQLKGITDIGIRLVPLRDDNR